MAVKNIYEQLYIMQISNLLLMNNFSFRLYINIPENYIAYKVFLAKSWKSLFFQDLEVFQVFRVLWQPWCCNSGYGGNSAKSISIFQICASQCQNILTYIQLYSPKKYLIGAICGEIPVHWYVPYKY